MRLLIKLQWNEYEPDYRKTMEIIEDYEKKNCVLPNVGDYINLDKRYVTYGEDDLLVIKRVFNPISGDVEITVKFPKKEPSD